MEEQNLGTVEQGVRIVAGSLSSLSGIVLLTPGNTSLTSGAVGIMLAIAGLYLLVTGSTGYCPIYCRLGWDKRPVHGQHNGPPVNRWRSHQGAGKGLKIWLMLLWCLSTTAAIAWIALEVWGS